MKRNLLILGIAVIMTILGQHLPIQELNSLARATPSEVSPSEPLEAPSASRADPLYPVVRVVDGDTIVAHIDGVDEKIRLIGINTPETVDPRRTVECFGKEASAVTKHLLTGTTVRLERDLSQGDRDKYGRLLRYVFLPDGTFVNKKLIEEGYAYEYTYRIPYRYQTEFKAAQTAARENARGLWAPEACVK